MSSISSDIGFYHPIVIHFAIALVTVGVVFRWVSLTGRVAFAGPAAASMIMLATMATLVAVQSGEDAQVAVETLPGAAGVVRAHEVWGHRTRDLVLALGGLELLALALRDRGQDRRILLASAGLGLVAFLSVLQTGKLGGDLVYAHAGGVGIRSGDPGDVTRLLLAGLYQEAALDEKAGRPDDAASLIGIAARRFPTDAAVQVRAAEVLLQDRHDPPGALAILGRLGATPNEPGLHFRENWLTADALDALGRHAEARDVLERLRAEFPDSARLRGRLARADADATTNHP